MKTFARASPAVGRSTELSHSLEETFQLAMTQGQDHPLAGIQRVLNRMHGGHPLHSGSFLSKMDAHPKRGSDRSFRQTEVPYSRKLTVEDLEFRERELSGDDDFAF